jgi:hypothetical protein
MAVSKSEKTATKTPVKKTETKKPAVKKATAAKTTTKSTAKARKISAEERYKMIEVAAYYIAEHHHFQGNAIDFWIAAEEEVRKKIA